MHARVVLRVGEGALFREVSSVQRRPYRAVPPYTRFRTLKLSYFKEVHVIERE